MKSRGFKPASLLKHEINLFKKRCVAIVWKNESSDFYYISLNAIKKYHVLGMCTLYRSFFTSVLFSCCCAFAKKQT